jgi:hypothetical protein
MAEGAVIELDATDRVPTPSQQRFLDTRERIAGFFGGYGSGKTSTGAEKALDLIAANPGCSGIIVAPTYGQLEKAALRSFFDPDAPDDGLCPKEWIAEVNIGKRYFLHPNGARTYWGSADNPKSLEGQNLAWFWLDEPGDCKLRAFQVLVGRLRDISAKWIQGYVTGTPRPGWLWREFNSGKAGRAVVHASTRENAAHLAPGTIEEMERTYSAREARVLIDGEFGLLVGAVYEEFEKRTHLVEWKYDPRFRTIEFWDFGYRRPYVGWAQLIPQGTVLQTAAGPVRVGAGGAWVIFDELTDENVTTEILAGRARQKGYQVDEIDCDPAGDGVQSATGLNDVAVLRSIRCMGGPRPEIRFTTEPRWRHIPNGVSIVRGMLRNARKEIRLFVARSLDDPRSKRGAVKMFEGYAYPEAKDGKPVGDEPLKDGLLDHAGDGIRYFGVRRYLEAMGSDARAIPSL